MISLKMPFVYPVKSAQVSVSQTSTSTMRSAVYAERHAEVAVAELPSGSDPTTPTEWASVGGAVRLPVGRGGIQGLVGYPNLEGPFSAVSKPTFAIQYSFARLKILIRRELQDLLAFSNEIRVP